MQHNKQKRDLFVVVFTIIILVVSFVVVLKPNKSQAMVVVDPDVFKDAPPEAPPTPGPPSPPPSDPNPSPGPTTNPDSNSSPNTSSGAESNNTTTTSTNDGGNTGGGEVTGETGASDARQCNEFEKLELNPESTLAEPESTIQFTAKALNSNGEIMTGFTFAFEAKKGTITSSGLHKTPNKKSAYSVIVTSDCDSSEIASVEVVSDLNKTLNNSECKKYLDCLRKGIIGYIKGVGEVTASALSKIIMFMVVVTFMGAIATIALANLMSFATLPEVLYGIVMSGIGKRRHGKSYGKIIDKKTNLPISLVRVQLVSKDAGRVIETRVTNKLGEYGFIVDPGDYTLVVSKSGYKRNTKEISLGKSGSGVEQVVVDNISLELDSKAKNLSRWVKVFGFFSNILKILNWVILSAGTLFSILAYYVSPNRINIVILLVYIPLWGYQIYQVKSKKAFGVVKHGKNAIDLAMIRVYRKQDKKLIRSAVSNIKGHYSVMLPRGEYSIYGSKGDLSSTVPEILKIKKGMSPSNKDLKLN